jgi:translation elongation factor EF-1alpha
MALDFDNVITGVAQVTLGTVEIGHTQGGVTSTITPQNRMRNVDKFGTSEVAVIHTGDQVRATVPFAEYTAVTLKEIYAAGQDATAASGSKFLGLGRSAGFIYPTKAMLVVPMLTADAAKRIELYATCPVGAIEQVFNNEADRIASVEFAALVDESKTDGQLIGKLQLTAA